MRRILCLAVIPLIAGCASSRSSVSSDASMENAPVVIVEQSTVSAISQIQQTTNPSVMSDASSGRNQFSLNLLKEVAKQTDDRSNVVVSPFSAGMALSMLMEGASGQTRDEIRTALSNSSFAGLSPQSDEFVTISSANSLWLKKGFSILPSYEDKMRDEFGAQVFVKDFSLPSTVGDINKWCSDHTGGKIPSIIDRIQNPMMMFILNALYFKASWDSPFEKESTVRDKFNSAKGEQTVSFMRNTRNYPYAELGGCQIVKLPYRGGRYFMLVALPGKGADPESLLAQLTAKDIELIDGSMKNQRLDLSLPKFKIEATMILNDVVNALGIRKAFTNSAEFDAMTSSSVAVDQVKQKVFIEVNEEGSEAAAVTSIGMRVTSVMPVQQPRIMKVDRPFIFSVMDGETLDLLFCGIINNIE